MPISTNTNIEFLYESPREEDTDIWVKYHTTEMGKTISLSLDKEKWFDFPALLFPEVTDHLRNRHNVLLPAIYSNPPYHGAPESQPSQPPQPSEPLQTLSFPQIEKSTATMSESTTEVEEEEEGPYIPPAIAEVAPVQSLTALAAGNVSSTEISEKPSATEEEPEIKTSSTKPPPVDRPVIRGVDEATSQSMRGHNESKGINRVD